MAGVEKVQTVSIMGFTGCDFGAPPLQHSSVKADIVCRWRSVIVFQSNVNCGHWKFLVIFTCYKILFWTKFLSTVYKYNSYSELKSNTVTDQAGFGWQVNLSTPVLGNKCNYILLILKNQILRIEVIGRYVHEMTNGVIKMLIC